MSVCSWPISKEMDLDGNIINIPESFQGKPLFRKHIDGWSHMGQLELAVAKKLKATPQDNVVKVYNVVEGPNAYYDAEFVAHKDIQDDDDKQTKAVDIALALEQLHSICVDLKEDNIGVGEDGKWKLYDFNCSGICRHDFMSWETEGQPEFYYAYKTALQQKFNISGGTFNVNTDKYTFDGFDLREIDSIMYTELLRTTFPSK